MKGNSLVKINTLMRSHEFISESTKKLPSLSKHSYSTLDRLVRGVKKHRVPQEWIQDKIEENDLGLDIAEEVKKFAAWAMKRVHLKKPIKVELSYDTEEAQTNHHTGSHTEGEDTVWVYAKNRNLVDILRTVFHEIVHCRQSELGMIKPGDSYPGSSIEALADMVAGKYIKIYGEKHNEIFQ